MHNEYYAKIIEQNTFKCCIYLILNSFINILYPFCWEEGGCASNQISKRGLTRPQLLDRGCREKGGDFFQGRVASFT